MSQIEHIDDEAAERMVVVDDVFFIYDGFVPEEKVKSLLLPILMIEILIAIIFGMSLMRFWLLRALMENIIFSRTVP